VSLLLLQGSVREQLEALCDISPVCAPTRLKRQREAVEQMRSDKEQLQAEVLALRMQLERSQAQVQQLQQQQLTAAQSGKQQG
jgi:predicted  nucleic acid-binding Zn-ribbon protein